MFSSRDRYPVYFHKAKIEFSWKAWPVDYALDQKLQGSVSCKAQLFLLATDKDSNEKGLSTFITEYHASWVLDAHNEWSVKNADDLPGPRGWPVPSHEQKEQLKAFLVSRAKKEVDNDDINRSQAV